MISLSSTYRLNLLGRATGDRSIDPSSVLSVRLESSSRWLPRCEALDLPPILPVENPDYSMPSLAATLLPRWQSGLSPSVRPSRTVLRLPRKHYSWAKQWKPPWWSERFCFSWAVSRNRVIWCRAERTNTFTYPRSACRAEISEEKRPIC